MPKFRIPKKLNTAEVVTKGSHKRVRAYKNKKPSAKPVRVLNAPTAVSDFDAGSSVDADELADVGIDNGNYFEDQMQVAAPERTVGLTVQKIYEVELMKAGGFHDVFNDRSKIIIPDFDNDKNQLQLTKLHISSEREFTLCFDDDSDHGGVQYVRCCTCDKTTHDFVMELPDTLSKHFDYKDGFSCIHINLIKSLTPDVTELFSMEDSAETTNKNNVSMISNLSFNESMLVAVVQGNIGVVGMDFTGLKCFICQKNTCIHVTYVKSFDISDPSAPPCLLEFPEFGNVILKRSRKSTCISKKKVCFEPDDDYKKKLRVSPQNIFESFGDPNALKIVNDTFTDKCNEDVHDTDLSQAQPYKRIPLIMKDEVLQCAMFSKSCKRDGCVAVSYYDGYEHAVLNMGSFLIHHRVLREYLHHFLMGNGVTLIGYYRVMKKNHEDMGGKLDDSLNYDNWRLAWYAYIKLLDLDMSKGFSCTICGTYPDIVVCDATSLGFQRKFSAIAFPKKKIETRSAIPRASDHKSRIVISSRPVRTLLSNWCKGDLEKTKKVKLISALSDYPELYEAFLWTEETFGAIPKPKGVTQFFASLSKPSPVCSYLPATELCFDLAEKLFSNEVQSDSSVMRNLYNQLPLFYNLLKALKLPCLPKQWKALIYRLIYLSKEPFSGIRCAEERITDDESPSMSFFPSLPMVRKRGLFAMDKVRDDKLCTKNYTSHKKLTSGIFTLYCVHGINYGFQAMESAESTDVPFSIYRTRLPIAPSVIIYDNSCNLHTYCLNRDPLFFQNTLFLVDRFHWYNHTGCSEGYNIRNYPLLAKVNSEINEQQNAATKKLKNQLSYMTPDNFMSHCILFLWYRNQLKHQQQKRRISSLVSLV